MKRFITTPIFYPNASPHVGHLYSLFLGDYFKRALAKDGRIAALAIGLDEHGDKVLNSAKDHGQEIGEYIKFRRAEYREVARKYAIEFDYFIQTDDEFHHEFSREMFEGFLKDGLIYEGKYRGNYLHQEERYLNDQEAEEYRKDPRYNIEVVEEEGFYLKVRRDKEFIDYVANRFSDRFSKAAVSISENQEDVFITREKAYGIKLKNGKTLYVWFDALLSYLSMMRIAQCQPEITLHIIGKDIIKFHAGIWFTIIKNLEIKEMERIHVHGHIVTSTGEKISKSLNNQPFTLEQLETEMNFPCYQDVLRMYLLQNNYELDFFLSMEGLKTFYRDFIVDKFSNLVHRVFSFLLKSNMKLSAENLERATARFYQFADQIERAHVQMDPRERVRGFWNAISFGNIFIERNRFWEQEDPTADLLVLANVIKAVSFIGEPFMPLSCHKIFDLYENLSGFSIRFRDSDHLLFKKEW